MLVLSRRPGEEIIINNNIKVTIVAVKGDRVRIGITAPEEVPVDRAEVHARRVQFFELPVGQLTGSDSAVDLGEVAVATHSAGDTAKH
jgi:carbon storage regulator